MSDRLLPAAKKVFPSAVSFTDYIHDLNKSLTKQSPSNRINLTHDNDDPTYIRFLSRLYVAWPRGYQSTLQLSQTVITTASVPIDDILSEVIRTTLRRHPNYYQTLQNNVLCAGFSVGSQYGTCSVLRDLDARSPSTAVQILRSPAAKQLLKRIGPIIFRHLLTYSVLLCSVQPHKSITSDRKLQSSFIQLCGPSPALTESLYQTANKRTISNILLRQDILYRGPTEKRIVSNPTRPEVNAQKQRACNFFNNGLPKSHHLQNIDESSDSAIYLLNVIFSIQNSNVHRISATGIGSQSRTCSISNKSWSNDYEINSSMLRQQITSTKRGKSWCKQKRAVSRRLRPLQSILKTVIQRIHTHQFRRILGRVCPITEHVRCKTKKGSNVQTKDLISMYTPAKDVALYLTSCVRAVIPRTLLGSKRNWELLEETIHELIRRRSLKDHFNILAYFKRSGFRISEVEWLHLSKSIKRNIVNPTDLRFRQTVCDNILVWIFRGVIIPILLQSFYGTETGIHKYRVFYYRREVWNHLAHRSMQEMLRRNAQFTILSKEKLVEHARRRKDVIVSLGRSLFPHPVLFYNTLRYIPKKSSLRGIQKPCAKMLTGFQGLRGSSSLNFEKKRSSCIQPIRKALIVFQLLMKNITKIVGFESRQRQSLRGSSVYSLDDVYEKFLDFKTHWMNVSNPEVFACCVDISKSFDTLPLKVIFSEVLPNIFSRNRYVLLKYRHYWYDSLVGKVRRRTTTHVCTRPGEETSLASFVRQKPSSGKVGGIYMDLSSVATLNTTDIITVLTEHLKTNIVSVPRQSRSRLESAFAMQRQGLPQGHPLSSMLTSLFYAHVENKDLSMFLNPPLTNLVQQNTTLTSHKHGAVPLPSSPNPSLLMRMVDDSIYLTCNRQLAERFVARMQEGWTESHGFSINVGKTRLSKSMDDESTQLIPWCGLLIDCTSLEVRVDYSRYDTPGIRLRNSFFIEYEQNPGTALAQKTWTCFKPKLHALLVDKRINSFQTIILNVYQAALMASLKTCAYLIETKPRNEQFLAEVLRTMISKFSVSVHRAGTSTIARARGCDFPLSANIIRFISIHALVSAITKRLIRYTSFRNFMQRSLETLQREYSKEEHQLEKSGQVSTIKSVETISKNECGMLWKLKL